MSYYSAAKMEHRPIEEFESRYSVLSVAGKGGFGLVHVVRRRDSGELYAVKGALVPKEKQVEVVQAPSTMAAGFEQGGVFGALRAYFGGGGSAAAPPHNPLRAPADAGGAAGAANASPAASRHSQGPNLFPKLPRKLQSLGLDEMAKDFRPSNWEILRREISFLRLLDHPNILRIVETFGSKDTLCAVLSYCAGGDLYTRCPYSEEQARRVVSEVLRAVSYMHAHEVCHRDIKPENIMFETSAPDSPVVLIDFGLAKHLKPKQKCYENFVGTVHTTAPELYSYVGYTNLSDVWQVGVVAYFMLANKVPFSPDSTNIVADVRSGKYDVACPRFRERSHNARHFVKHVLQVNPARRPSAAAAMEHPWVVEEAVGTLGHPERLEYMERWGLVGRDVRVSVSRSSINSGSTISEYTGYGGSSIPSTFSEEERERDRDAAEVGHVGGAIEPTPLTFEGSLHALRSTAAAPHRRGHRMHPGPSSRVSEVAFDEADEQQSEHSGSDEFASAAASAPAATGAASAAGSTLRSSDISVDVRNVPGAAHGASSASSSVRSGATAAGSEDHHDVLSPERVAKSFAQYGQYSTVKRIAHLILARTSNKAELRRLRDTFLVLDRDASGAIDVELLASALRAYLTEEALNAAIDAADPRGKGTIEYSEFLAAALEAVQEVDDAALEEAFDRLGLDKGYKGLDGIARHLGLPPTRPAHAAPPSLISAMGLRKEPAMSLDEFKELCHEPAPSAISPTLSLGASGSARGSVGAGSMPPAGEPSGEEDAASRSAERERTRDIVET